MWSTCRLVVDIANIRTATALVDGDDGSAGATTRVVHPVATGFYRYKVYRLAAVDDCEVWQHLTGVPG